MVVDDRWWNNVTFAFIYKASCRCIQFGVTMVTASVFLSFSRKLWSDCYSSWHQDLVHHPSDCWCCCSRVFSIWSSSLHVLSICIITGVPRERHPAVDKPGFLPRSSHWGTRVGGRQHRCCPRGITHKGISDAMKQLRC